MEKEQNTLSLREQVEIIHRQQIARGVPLDFRTDEQPVTLTAIFDAKSPERYDSPDWIGRTLDVAKTRPRDTEFIERVMQESGAGTEGRARVIEEQIRRNK